MSLLSIGRVLKNSDAIFFGVTKEAELARLEKIKASLKANGALWIIRPKGRPEISERATMAAGIAAGLVDGGELGPGIDHGVRVTEIICAIENSILTGQTVDLSVPAAQTAR